MHFVHRLQDRVDDWKQSVKERLSPSAATIPQRWVRLPELQTGDKLCLFVTVLRDKLILPHAAYQARAWAAHGFKVVVIVVTDDLAVDDYINDIAFADGILIRHNQGYDFGAWSAAIQSLPKANLSDVLALSNDSVFGPMHGFSAILDHVENSKADIIALTDSYHHHYHFQSYLLFYKPGALRSRAFVNFWSSIKTGDRWMVIVRYETRLLKILSAAGLKGEVLFPAAPGPARTLLGWKSLIDQGFPFIKVQLLRDNPFRDDVAGWRDLVRQRGYDPTLCDAVLTIDR